MIVIFRGIIYKFDDVMHCPKCFYPMEQRTGSLACSRPGCWTEIWQV